MLPCTTRIGDLPAICLRLLDHCREVVSVIGRTSRSAGIAAEPFHAACNLNRQFGILFILM